MEDEIDLREYVRVLLQRWKLILGLTVVGATIAAVVSLVLPPTYESTALVSVAQGRYTLRLDDATQGALPLPLKAYPDLALSDEVVADVFNQVKNSLPSSVNTLSKFRRFLKATPAADPSLLRLTVRAEDPALTAQIANTWAKTLTASAGRLYGQDAANLAIYQEQVAIAKTDLGTAESALRTFQATNQTTVISATLLSKQTILADNLSRTYDFDLLRQDAQDLVTRLTKLDPQTPSTLADDLAVLSLTERALSTHSNENQSSPFLLQIGSGQSFSGRSVSEQIAVINELLHTLQARTQDFQTQIDELGPVILELQGKLAEAQTQEVQLKRARDLAEAQYKALASKVEEAKIAVQESANVVQTASEAAVPTARVSPKGALNTALGGALGWLLSTLAVFLWEWWRGEARPAPQPMPVVAGQRQLERE